MKKKYSEPETKFVKFNVRDIVITSGPTAEVENGGVYSENGEGLEDDQG